MDTKSYTFPRALRLVHAKDYERVFRHPNKVLTREVTIFARQNRLEHGRLGLVIKRKQIKKAAQRNRVKRVVRESFRLNQYELVGLDVVVMTNKKTAGLTNEELRTCLDGLWKELAVYVA